VQLDEAGGERGPVEDLLQALGRDVLDLRPPLSEAADLPLLGVHADHVAVGLGEGDSQREADVAQPYDPDLHRRQPTFGLGRRGKRCFAPLGGVWWRTPRAGAPARGGVATARCRRSATHQPPEDETHDRCHEAVATLVSGEH
jgi:hypothetical protein